MYVIIVYDIEEERVNKIKKILRMYLTWVQNSVFEGEIKESQLLRLKQLLLETIKEKDSIRLYIIENPRLVKKEILGVSKGDWESNII
ncbi:MAG: CRISPR-associated endonuclease Cas2 [Candidatus Micrarchaeota archaeon]|nr:CRISPR-associated endonuclease Cas2 [Candidatus Micrarchaeota archaeon]